MPESIPVAATRQRIDGAVRLRPSETLTAVEVNSDLAFADSRVRLAREVAGWLSGVAGVGR